MLQSMHERMKGVIAWIIVALVAVTFALWGVQYYLHGNSEAGIVAKVNGENITDQQVQRIYSRVQQQELAMLGKDSSFDQKTQTQLKQKVIQQIIKNKVLLGFANKLGLYIGRQQIQGGIMGLPIFQVNGGFSPERFQQVIRGFFYSEQDFAEELQSTLLLGQLELGIVGSAFVLPNEEEMAIKLLKQTRDFGYFIISPQAFVPKVNLTEAEINQYYKEHQNKFITPEKVSIEYIELNANALKKKIDTNDAKLDQFAKEHADLFTKDKSKAKVKAAYEHQVLQQMLADQSEKLADLTYTNSGSLVPAATALGLDIKTSELFTNKGATSGIAANPKIVKVAFSETVLKQGYNSNAVEIGDNDVVILRIKQHLAETVLPLDKVKNDAIAALKKEKARELAQQNAHEILQALQNESPQVVGKKYNLTWQNVAAAARQMPNGKVDAEILHAAFDLPQAQLNPAVPNKKLYPTNIVDLQDKGFAVIQVTKVYDGDSKKIAAKERQGIHDSFLNDLGQYEYNLLVTEKMNKAEITMMNNKVEDQQ